jgi:hypothetical protein
MLTFFHISTLSLYEVHKMKACPSTHMAHIKTHLMDLDEMWYEVHVMWVPVITAWRVLGLRIEETASGWGRKQRIYWISSRGQTTRGCPAAWGMGEGLKLTVKKTCYQMLRRASELAGSTFGFHKRWGISWLAGWLIASQKRLCSIGLVSQLVMGYSPTFAR